MASHDIIDNRTESLAEHIGQLLANSQRAKLAVGYFFLSGFEPIADRLQGIDELRLLIGNTSTRETIEQLVEGYNRLDTVEQLTEKQQYLTPRSAEGRCSGYCQTYPPRHRDDGSDR